MKWTKSKALTSAFLMGTGLALNACAATNQINIPDSLKAPCVSTVNVEEAQTIGDLSKAIIAGDGDLRVCDVRREAVVAIAESRNRPWWKIF